MYQTRAVKGLVIALFAVITLVPDSLVAQDACMAAWTTDPIASYQRAEMQAQGQAFVDCGGACEPDAAEDLASHERAVLQASGQVLTGDPEAALEVLARAEMQAQGQVFIEADTLTCTSSESALS